MAMTYVWIYLAVWAVTAVTTFGVARRFGERSHQEAIEVVVVSIVTGALWPVVIIAVAELSSVAVYKTFVKRRLRRLPRHRAHEVAVAGITPKLNIPARGQGLGPRHPWEVSAGR